MSHKLENILDDASWYKSKRLNFHHFELEFLPGYSPYFNPIERLCLALNGFINDPRKIASQHAFRKSVSEVPLDLLEAKKRE